jgi:hypothetical protein
MWAESPTYVVLLIAIMIIILFFCTNTSDKQIEHLTSTSNESVQNLASVYNKDNIDVTNLTATNTGTVAKLNVTDSATINNANVKSNAQISGNLKVNSGIIGNDSNSPMRFTTNNAPFVWSPNSSSTVMNLDPTNGLSVSNSLKVQGNTFQPVYFSIYPWHKRGVGSTTSTPKRCLRAIEGQANQVGLDTCNPADPGFQFYWNGYHLVNRKYNKCLGISPNATYGSYNAATDPKTKVELYDCSQHNSMFWKQFDNRIQNQRAYNPMRMNDDKIDIWKGDCGDDCQLFPY